MICPRCKQDKLTLDIEITPGCSGHHGPDSYCYCPPPDVSLSLCCFAQVGKNRYCGYKKLVVKDKFEFEQWLIKNIDKLF